jgi:hypothetical protein
MVFDSGTRLVFSGVDEADTDHILSILRNRRPGVTATGFWFRADLRHTEVTIGDGNLEALKGVMEAFRVQRPGVWGGSVYFDGEIRALFSERGGEDIRAGGGR